MLAGASAAVGAFEAAAASLAAALKRLNKFLKEFSFAKGAAGGIILLALCFTERDFEAAGGAGLTKAALAAALRAGTCWLFIPLLKKTTIRQIPAVTRRASARGFLLFRTGALEGAGL